MQIQDNLHVVLFSDKINFVNFTSAEFGHSIKIHVFLGGFFCFN